MPRPRKNVQQRRSYQVIFRLTPAEYERLREVAAKADLPVNELARRLTSSRRERVTFEQGFRSDPALISQIRKIGLNLNQLVHNAHIFGRVSPKVEQLCDHIRELVFEAVEERTQP